MLWDTTCSCRVFALVSEIQNWKYLPVSLTHATRASVLSPGSFHSLSWMDPPTTQDSYWSKSSCPVGWALPGVELSSLASAVSVGHWLLHLCSCLHQPGVGRPASLSFRCELLLGGTGYVCFCSGSSPVSALTDAHVGFSRLCIYELPPVWSQAW